MKGARPGLAAAALAMGAVTLRLAYHLWFSSWELVGDEAYYWVESRHLDFGYVEKGPLLPWTIALSCRLFGDTELAVRLPAIAAFSLAAWGIGRIGLTVGGSRVAFLSVATFCLIPAFQANAQLATQDALVIALWVALTAAGLRLFRRWRAGSSTWGPWFLLWLLAGIGTLLKQTAVLFLPSVALYAFLERRRLPWRRSLVFQQLAGFALFLACVSPMIVWNERHGWPMLAHTLGHLGAGGDRPGPVDRAHPVASLLSILGGLAGAAGPAFLLLLAFAMRQVEREGDDRLRRETRWLLCAAAPGVVFFVLLALTKPVVASWPLPALVPLVVPVALLLAGPRGRDRRVRTAWRVLIGYGLAAQLLLFFPAPLARLPFFGGRIARDVLSRFSGRREQARTVEALAAGTQTADGRPPLIVAPHYMDASLLTFYMAGHPTVIPAGAPNGRRPTSFDVWPDTRPDSPALAGRARIVVGPFSGP